MLKGIDDFPCKRTAVMFSGKESLKMVLHMNYFCDMQRWPQSRAAYLMIKKNIYIAFYIKAYNTDQALPINVHNPNQVKAIP